MLDSPSLAMLAMLASVVAFGSQGSAVVVLSCVVLSCVVAVTIELDEVDASSN